MEALILGRPGVERSRLEQLLADDGMTVRTCHDRAWGCVGMHDRCPLDDTTVEVAVAVAEPGDRFDPHGVACAHRARIPVVTVGATAGDPVLDFATFDHGRVDEAIAVTVRAAARDASRHRRAIEAATPDFLHDGESITVEVRREASSIHVDVAGRFGEDRVTSIADHVRAAVRAFDPHVSVIDVSVASPTT